MPHVTQRELSPCLTQTLAQLASGGAPVIIDDVAMMISAREYRLLRELEDRLDLADMAKAKAESEGTLPYDLARKELGV